MQTLSTTPPGTLSIRIDQTSFRTITSEPAAVLADAESFWQTDPAYMLVGAWHEYMDVPVPWPQWSRVIECIESQWAGRGCHPFLDEFLHGFEGAFREAASNLGAFWTEGKMPGVQRVHLTLATLPDVIQCGDRIVVNLLHPAHGACTRRIVARLMGHLFHLRQADAQLLQRGARAPMGTPEGLITLIRNHGCADLLARSEPASFADLPSADAPQAEPQSVEELVQLIRDCGTLLDSCNEPRASPAGNALRVWKWAVADHGARRLGGHMARTIERQCGRRELAALLHEEAHRFVERYNGLSCANIQLDLPRRDDAPDALSLLGSALRENRSRKIHQRLATVEKGETLSEDDAYRVLRCLRLAGRLRQARVFGNLAADAHPCSVRIGLERVEILATAGKTRLASSAIDDVVAVNRDSTLAAIRKIEMDCVNG